MWGTLLFSGWSSTVALAAVALLAYGLGRRRSIDATSAAQNARREVKRAKAIARQLETVARDVRRNLAWHHANVLRFQQRMTQLSQEGHPGEAQSLGDEAARLLEPTLQLATKIAEAYDHIRQQSSRLRSFGGIRTDGLTGMANRQSLEETLAACCELTTKYHGSFSLVLVELDPPSPEETETEPNVQHLVRDLSRLLTQATRESDVVARFAEREFALVLPETNLAGACIVAERVRSAVQERLKRTVSVGVGLGEQRDTPANVINRVDTALYSARDAGGNCVYRHDGTRIEPLFDANAAEVAALVMQ